MQRIPAFKPITQETDNALDAFLVAIGITEEIIEEILSAIATLPPALQTRPLRAYDGIVKRLAKKRVAIDRANTAKLLDFLRDIEF